MSDGTTSDTVVVSEGCQNTTILAIDAEFLGRDAKDDSGAKSCEGKILAVALVLNQVLFTVEGGDVAVVADAKTDVDLVQEGDWDTRNSGDKRHRGTSGSASVRDGRRLSSDGGSFAIDGNGSSDDGGDAEQLHDGQ